MPSSPMEIPSSRAQKGDSTGNPFQSGAVTPLENSCPWKHRMPTSLESAVSNRSSSAHKFHPFSRRHLQLFHNMPWNIGIEYLFIILQQWQDLSMNIRSQLINKAWTVDQR